MLLVDYGYPRAEYYLPSRSTGTLLCYFRHHAHGDPFVWPGLNDITAFVDFTAIAEAGFEGDLALGAALLLVRQVQVFQARLVFRVHDGVEQLGRHLVLFRDRGHDGGAPLFQFAQVAQALFEQAQLDIVEAAGRFLAVTGDEGHGGAFVEQFDGGGNLHRFGGKFKGKALFDSGQHGCFQSDQAWNDTQSARLRNLDSANGLCVGNSVNGAAAAGWRTAPAPAPASAA